MIINPYRFAAQSSLLTGLVSWWSLEEASGARADSHGSNDLTSSSGTIANAAGLVNNAADFTGVAAAQELYVAAGHGLHGGARDWTFAAWGKPPVGGGASDSLASCAAATNATNTDFLFQTFNSTTMRFYLGNGGAWKTLDVSQTEGSWNLYIFWYDATAQIMYGSRNNGSTVSTTGVTTPNNAGGTFYLGQWSTAANDWHGLIDEAGFWSRVLTADERTALYNSGSGIGYPG